MGVTRSSTAHKHLHNHTAAAGAIGCAESCSGGVKYEQPGGVLVVVCCFFPLTSRLTVLMRVSVLVVYMCFSPIDRGSVCGCGRVVCPLRAPFCQVNPCFHAPPRLRRCSYEGRAGGRVVGHALATHPFCEAIFSSRSCVRLRRYARVGERRGLWQLEKLRGRYSREVTLEFCPVRRKGCKRGRAAAYACVLCLCGDMGAGSKVRGAGRGGAWFRGKIFVQVVRFSR